ncbi:MAG: hypothetical protein K6L80_01405 [Agarilytica sp.]
MKKQLMNVCWVMAVLLFSLNAEANPKGEIERLLEEEKNRYIDLLRTSKGEALFELAKKLQDSGVENKEVLDEAMKVAVEHHLIYNNDKKQIVSHHIAASLARALSGSGNANYHSTLTRFMNESASRRLRNLSKTLLSRITWYEKRNKIMNDFSNHQSEQSLHTTRYLNLIQHKEINFARYAAESLARQGRTDKVFLDAMAEVVAANYRASGLAPGELDGLAWLMRALGRAPDRAYEDLLNEIAAYPSLDKKLKKHVKKALKGK